MPRNDSYAGTFRNDEWDDRPIADSSMIPLQMIMFAVLAQRSMYANAFVIGSELVELPTKVDLSWPHSSRHLDKWKFPSLRARKSFERKGSRDQEILPQSLSGIKVEETLA